jgi:rare lipoprotein A (peptidoglycan hydrolase)
MALIAILTSAAVPGPVGSRAPSPRVNPVATQFSAIETIASVRGSVVTTSNHDQEDRSDGNLDHSSILIEPSQRSEPPQARPAAAQPDPKPQAVSKNPWRRDSNISWYGPGFYGRRTACGLELTRELIGVAHRSLPCGTRISFRHNGVVVTAPVVDRGPYVGGRIFDMTGGLCTALDHCYTGSIEWRYASGG